MKHLLCSVAIALAAIGAAEGPAWAQASLPPIPPQTASAAYAGAANYGLNALTPMDAYRQGLMTRWELERLEGPLPQALQGPSVDGMKGFDPGN